MASEPTSILEKRRDQALPILEALEIDRIRRFGECRSFEPGSKLFTAGQVAPGLIVILAGKIEVSRRDKTNRMIPIVTHGPGHFLGELAQLAGRPALADAVAVEPVRALIIPRIASAHS